MTEALLLKIVEVGLFAFEMGVERKAISDVVAKNAANPEAIPAMLSAMAAESLMKLFNATKI